MKKVLITIGNILYVVFIVAVVAFALLFVGTKIDVLGYEVKVVQSGSMEPSIQTGGIVIIAPQESYGVGDVVTFGQDTQRVVPVTHRIVEQRENGRRVAFVTKGDANEEADSATITTRDIIGKVVFTIPYVGFVIEFARTPLGFALLIGIPALVIVLDELANIVWEIHKYRYRLRRQGKVGYRTPSRERQPRERIVSQKKVLIRPHKRPLTTDIRSEAVITRTQPTLAPLRTMQHAADQQDFVLDLRAFKPYRHV